jgi:hypothetical protein
MSGRNTGATAGKKKPVVTDALLLGALAALQKSDDPAALAAISQVKGLLEESTERKLKQSGGPSIQLKVQQAQNVSPQARAPTVSFLGRLATSL